MSKKGIVILILGGFVMFAGLIFFADRPSAPVADPPAGLSADKAGGAGNWEDNLVPVDSIYYEFSNNHLHGLGYDPENERVFLASHYGLFVIMDRQSRRSQGGVGTPTGASELYQLGDNRDDFMGFSLNQREPNIVYSSGHPRTGGNLGVMKSEDGGLTFDRIFSNLPDRQAGIGEGRVDFHSMTISYVNPDILYGFHQGRLYRTKAGGDSWEFAQAQNLPQQGFCWGAPCLAADTQDENVLYAGTQSGLAKSADFGDTWEIVEGDTGTGAVVSLGVDPQNNERMFAFTENHSVADSVDGGKTWEQKNSDLQLGAQEFVFAFSFDTNNPDRIFLATTGNQVYRTENGGESWEKIL